MATFRLLLEYDGTEFEGWQVQPEGHRTVQGTLLSALGELARGPVRLMGAGRTDAGVHAEGQVASAALDTSLDAATLVRALNAKLPTDLAVVEAWPARADFDARRDSRGKLYRYEVWNSPVPAPLRRRRTHHVREPIDLPAVRRAAEPLLGTHDFACFKAAGSAVRTTVRTLRRLDVIGETGGTIRLELEGDGFLRHMVRNIAGTLLEVGRHRREATTTPAAAGLPRPPSRGADGSRLRADPRARGLRRGPLGGDRTAPWGTRGPGTARILRVPGGLDAFCLTLRGPSPISPGSRADPRGPRPQETCRMGAQAHKATQSAKASEVDRRWYVIDAEDMVLGRLATRVAMVLRGKHKPIFTPHVDTGDFVIVINAEKIKLTGNKREQKTYYRHSGWVGGIKEITAEKILEGPHPDRVVTSAIRGMLPKNSLGRKQLTKLKVYAGAEHPHRGSEAGGALAVTDTTHAEATGRRKSSVSHVWLTLGTGQFLINGRSLEEYFPRESLRTLINAPLETAGVVGQYDIKANIKGGGVAGQAGALRHSISRALEKVDPNLRAGLKKAGFLTRDARKVERKKYGQRGARARFQFSKR